MDYANGKIYTIRSYLTDNIYIGSTTQSLTKRLSKHKADYKWFITGNGNNVTSFEIIKFGDAYIELLEEFPCETKNQLCKREGELIRENNCVNKNIAGRTRAEYRDDNKDKNNENQKLYYQDNKDKYNEYNKQYRELHQDKINEKFVCECGGKYNNNHKAEHLKTKKHLKFAQICIPQQNQA